MSYFKEVESETQIGTDLKNSLENNNNNNNNIIEDENPKMNTPRKEEIDLKTNLKTALFLANNAIANDNKKLYSEAIAGYSEAINILEGEIIYAPQEIQSKMGFLIKEYTSRKDEIIKNTDSLTPTNTGYQFEFTYPPPSEHVRNPPQNKYLKPYWMMKLFEISINSGEYLTPKIYIPQYLWFYQPNFKATNSKIQCCESIANQLPNLKKITGSQSQLSIELEKFVNLINYLQNSLSNFLPFIPSIKQDKKIGTTVKKSLKKISTKSTKTSSEAYIFSLLELFESVSFLETMTEDATQGKFDSTISSFLARISEFFEIVICTMVLKDLEGLIEQVLKTNRDENLKE